MVLTMKNKERTHIFQRVAAVFTYCNPRHRYFKSLKNPARILEIGCGTGQNLTVLHKLYPSSELYGVDLLEKSQIPPFIHYQTTDLNTSPIDYPDGFFDVVIFTHVIEHLVNPSGLGPQIHRILAPGGRLYAEAPNWTSLLIPSFGFKREQGNIFNFFDDRTHCKPWTNHSLYTFVQWDCNLRVLQAGVIRNWVRLPFDWLIMLYGMLRGSRAYVASSLWNIGGCCVRAIGIKP